MFKIGPVLFTRYGPQIVKEIQSLGSNVFLDLKLYDIPNTVAETVKALKELRIAMFTVHISGGNEVGLSFINSLVNMQFLCPPDKEIVSNTGGVTILFLVLLIAI